MYLSVPIGPEDKLMFNAHRIFKPSTIVNEADMKLEQFDYIKDYKVINCTIDAYKEEQDFLCGLFVFSK